MQQGEIGADHVITCTHAGSAFGQLFIAGLVHLWRTGRSRRSDQRGIAIHACGVDAPVSQGAQQPAFTTAQVEHPLRLATEYGQQDGLVGHLSAAFDGATAHGVDPGLGVVLPAVQQGGFAAVHCTLQCSGTAQA
ncbi:hypothetical protein D3C76_1417250 [compost metagenome]